MGAKVFYTESEIIKMLKASQGKMSQAAFARKLKMSPTYLCDTYAGRRPVGPIVLDFLNLEKVFRRKAA